MANRKGVSYRKCFECGKGIRPGEGRMLLVGGQRRWFHARRPNDCAESVIPDAPPRWAIQLKKAKIPGY